AFVAQVQLAVPPVASVEAAGARDRPPALHAARRLDAGVRAGRAGDQDVHLRDARRQLLQVARVAVGRERRLEEIHADARIGLFKGVLLELAPRLAALAPDAHLA